MRFPLFAVSCDTQARFSPYETTSASGLVQGDISLPSCTCNARNVFVEDCSRFYLDSLNPHLWGLRELQIDTKALSEGPSRHPERLGPLSRCAAHRHSALRVSAACARSQRVLSRRHDKLRFLPRHPRVSAWRHECFRGPQQRLDALSSTGADGARRKLRRERKAYPGGAQEPANSGREREPRGIGHAGLCEHPALTDRLLSARSRLRSAAHQRARASAAQEHPEQSHRADGDAFEPTLRHAAAEEPVASRLYRRRYCKLLAALHDQQPPACLPPLS